MERIITFLIQPPATLDSNVMPQITDINTLGTAIWTYFQSIAAILGVIFLIVSGYMYFTAFGDDEKAGKARKSMVFTIMGLVLVSGASIVVKTITDSIKDYTITAQPVIELADTVVGFLFAGAMAIATLFLIIAGYQFITAHGDDEKVKKALGSVRNCVIGLSVMSLAYVIVGLFFDRSTGETLGRINAGKAVALLVGMTKVLLSIVGFLAILMLIFSGLQYITARGDDDQMGKAKKGIFGSVIGILIIVFSWSLATIAFKIGPA